MKNTATGAIVNVSEEKAARLDHEWEPADDAKPKRQRAPKKPADDE